MQETLKDRVPRIARGESNDVAARFVFQDGAAVRVARRFPNQRRGEHPGPFHAREIAIVRHAPHIADSALGVAAAQSDELRKKPRERAGAREPVVVDAEPEITVGAARVRGEQPAVDIAHRFRVFGRAERMSMLLPLARAIPERGGAPELGAGRLRAPQRDIEQ